MNKINFLSLNLLLLGATALGMNNPEKELLDAAWTGDFKEVVRLIAQGASVEAKNSNGGLTPLIVAAGKGHEGICRLLIANKAPVEAKDDEGRTPLMVSAEKGHEFMVRLLIENKAAVEIKDNDGDTPLMQAALYGHEAVCRLLIKNKAAIEAKNNYGWNPLICAARDGHEAVCRLLIEHKASIKEKRNNGETALFSADWYRHDVVCKLLIDAQLEPIRKSKAAIIALLGIAKKRLAKLSCRIPYDVAKIIARKAFATVQQDKQLLFAQINEILNKEKRANWLAYAKQQMNSPIVITQDTDDDKAHIGIPAQDIKPEKPQLVEKCTLQ